ncbi:hypothetical protein Tco_0815200 [Tanacetum coccineum]
MPTQNRIYIAPSHTKKIFGNMRRVGKCFSGRETPLLQTMVVQDQAEMGEDEAVYKDLDDSLVRAATTASSLEAEQDSGNIAKTKATPNESSSLGTTSGGGPRRQETMGDTIAQTRFENVSKHSNDPLLARGNILRSGKDSLKLNELMELCTNLQTRVLDLEKTKTTQAKEIVTMVESYEDEESLGEDASKQERINAIDVYKDITLVNDIDDANMFDVNTLTGDEFKRPSVPVSATSTKVTAATTTTTVTIPTPRKEIIITELEPKKPLKKKDQISFDEQEAIRLQDKFDEEERLARDKDGANVALTEEWDDIQAKQRRKHFADKRAEEKRNKPPTKTQQKKTMITYIKNMEGWKHKYLKSKDFDSIKELFDKAFKRVNMFMDYRTNLVEGSSKRAVDELEQEVTKKQKVDDVQETAEVDDDQEAAKIKELMEIVPKRRGSSN